MKMIDSDLLILIIITLLLCSIAGKIIRVYYSTSRPQKPSQNSTPKPIIHITHPLITKLYEQYNITMIDQKDIFIGLFCCWINKGHCLLTGGPGTGKTQAAKTFATLLNMDIGRVQGTSDITPSDITGSLIYNPKTNELETTFGPIMHQCVIVDEINRMPSKTQSSLLQAMAEGHITISQHQYHLPDNFMVIATQNPYDRIGTFPLPQAQLDRFMCQVIVESPSLEVQTKILQHQPNTPQAIASHIIKEIKNEYNTINISQQLITSIAQITQEHGLSSRAGQHITGFARALALLQSKKQVDITDITTALSYTISHRVSS